MTDDTTRDADTPAPLDTSARTTEPMPALRPRRGLAGEQLRAAAKVMESNIGKAQARARSLNAESARLDA